MSWLLAIKLLLAPALILGATAISKRWGPQAAGLFGGLPLTSGPISVVLCLQDGPAFAARAAAGVLTGLEGSLAFCWAYAWLATNFGPAHVSLLGASAAYVGVMCALLALPPLDPLAATLLVASTLAGALRALPKPEGSLPRKAESEALDVIIRVALTMAMVFTLTNVADRLGSRLTGVISPFPVFAAVMAGFTHRAEGARATVELMRGVLRSSWAFLAFFLVLVLVLPNLPLAAYGAALLAAGGVQLVTKLLAGRLAVRGSATA